MATNKSYLHVNYELFDSTTDTTTIIRESEVGPGDTEIIQRERFSKVGEVRLVVHDRDLPLLIEALQKRYEDSKKGEGYGGILQS